MGIKIDLRKQKDRDEIEKKKDCDTIAMMVTHCNEMLDLTPQNRPVRHAHC
jgi:hypothetical protein